MTAPLREVVLPTTEQLVAIEWKPGVRIVTALLECGHHKEFWGGFVPRRTRCLLCREGV